MRINNAKYRKMHYVLDVNSFLNNKLIIQVSVVAVMFKGENHSPNQLNLPKKKSKTNKQMKRKPLSFTILNICKFVFHIPRYTVK